MSRYSLNLPEQLKATAEDWATRQGISLNEFILWAVAEKVGALEQRLDDPLFPLITYRRGGSGIPRPVIRGTAIHVQTIAILHNDWQMALEAIASEYDLSTRQVEEAFRFYEAHRDEIEAYIVFEEQLAPDLSG